MSVFLVLWTMAKKFHEKAQPSIEYLELYTVVVGVVNWIHRFKNRRIILFCDNKSVVDIINATTSSCKNCMVLVQILVLQSLTNNVRVFAKYIPSGENIYSDVLSRLKLQKFWNLAQENGKVFERHRTEIPNLLWPIEKIWLK